MSISAPSFLPSATRTTTNGQQVALKLMRHTWGVETPLYDFFKNIKQNGKPYDGIEGGLVWLNEQQKKELKQCQQELNMEFVAMIFTDLPFAPKQSISDHIDEFKRQVQEASSYNPIMYNVHAGKDSWSFDEACDFFTQILEICNTIPVPVVFETHRGRILFNPWITRDIVKKFPSIRLCADLSHWVVVCERLLESELHIIKQIAPNVHHIHARVGYENGPQVPDPRAPEYAAHLSAHESYWEIIFQAAQQRNAAALTLTPEFGPPSYMQTVPFTNVPVSNLEQICDWMAARVQRRFAGEQVDPK